MPDLESIFPSTLKYKVLESKHEEYIVDYWEKLNAMYEGGYRLFNSPYLKDIFLKHAYEQPNIYNERKKRAFYINYAGEIIDYICAALAMHPVHVESEEEVDQFYKDFKEDVSPAGGERVSLHKHITDQVRDALVYGRVWTMVDLPPVYEPIGEVLSEAAQEESGLLNAYALSVPPRNVTNWSSNEDGNLEWAKLCYETKRYGFTEDSCEITKLYTIYTASAWARYKVTYNPDINPPRDEDDILLVDSGVHSFERVPLIPFKLPPGLWAMNKLYSVAMEHFNKRCALSWAEYKSLFAERYEFLEGCEDACDDISDDKERAVNQVRGQGYTQVRAQNDRVEYVGPPTEAFAYCLDNLSALRDEMHRITHQMALSVGTEASAVRRSGDSKEQDRQDTVVILNELGQLAREHVRRMYEAIATGRADNYKFNVSGLDEFEDLDVSGVLNQAVVLKDVDVPSPKFKIAHKFEVARATMGQKLSADELKEVRSEIEEAFKDEKPETAENRMLRAMKEAPGMVDNQFGNEPYKNRDNRKLSKGQENNEN